MDTGTECTECSSVVPCPGGSGIGVLAAAAALVTGRATAVVDGGGVDGVGRVGAPESEGAGPADGRGDVSVDVNDVANEDSDERGVG